MGQGPSVRQPTLATPSSPNGPRRTQSTMGQQPGPSSSGASRRTGTESITDDGMEYNVASFRDMLALGPESGLNSTRMLGLGNAGGRSRQARQARSNSVGSQESGSGSNSDLAATMLQLNRLLRSRGANPMLQLRYFDFKCPMCNKSVPTDDIECHLVMCLTRPRIGYNEDVLCEDKDECVICLEALVQGDTIARLPCLCIYHKSCIDSWFKVKNSCPEHPGED